LRLPPPRDGSARGSPRSAADPLFIETSLAPLHERLWIVCVQRINARNSQAVAELETQRNDPGGGSC
jgi:hypothetical protein